MVDKERSNGETESSIEKEIQEIEAATERVPLAQLGDFLLEHPEIQERLNRLRNSAEYQAYQQAQLQLFEQRLEAEKFRKFKKRYWWFIGEMPITLPKHIDQLDQSGLDLDEVILAVFEGNPRNYESMFDSLLSNPLLLEHRKETIREAIACYRHKFYQATVCLTLPQFEGVLRDFAGTFGLVEAGCRENSSFVWCVLGRLEKRLRQRWKNSPYANLYTVSVLGEVIYPERKLSPLRRHSILHGQVTDFGTQINALRALAALETLLRVAYESFFQE